MAVIRDAAKAYPGRMLMKRTTFGLATILVVFVTVFAVLVVHPVRTVKAHHGCSEATLQGNYGVVGSGFIAFGGWTPLNFSLLVNFDGNGHFRGSSLNFIEGGNTSSDVATSFTGGTYTVNSDCTCTLTTPAIAGDILEFYGIVVDTGGDEVAGNVYDTTEVGEITMTFDAKRVAEGKWAFLD